MLQKHKRSMGAFISTDLGENAWEGQGWGKTVVSVKASLEQTAAFFWDVNSRVNTSSDPTVEVIDEKGFEKTIKRTELLGRLKGFRSIGEFTSRMKLVRTGQNSLVLDVVDVKGPSKKGEIENKRKSSRRRSSLMRQLMK